MRAYVDGVEVVVAGPNLRACLDAARVESERRGRVVVQAAIDGRALTDDELAEPSGAARPGAEVRFATADPWELVQSTLEGVARALADAEPLHAEAARHIQAGRLDQGVAGLREVLAVWEQTHRAVVSGRELLAGMNLGGGSSPAQSRLFESIDGLRGQLHALKDALSLQDWSGVADVLAYDLREQSVLWSTRLWEFSRSLDRGSSIDGAPAARDAR